jgi:multidrug efflux system outer membrane protein
MQASAMAKDWFHPLHLTQKEVKFNIPNKYTLSPLQDYQRLEESDSAASINWPVFFSDPYLIALIETALQNNQELNIFLQDIEIAKNEIEEKQGEYLPKVGLGMGADKYKTPRYTRLGALDTLIDRNEIRDRNLDLNLGANMSWELDLWRKLRNAKNAATMRLRAQYEGRKFLVSRLVSEIARSYYELMALDNSLSIIDENIVIQDKAFHKMQLLKEYARSNQLAVNRFEAQLLKTKSHRFDISQQIIEKENRLKFLSGIYDDKKILRNSEKLMSLQVNELQIGVPVQLLENRPDIRETEYAIKAARLDLKSLKASLYPSVSIKAGIGFAAFDPTLIFNPKSLAYNLMGDLMTPLINRKALIARIQSADSYQTQRVLEYEQALLQAYTEVLNQVSKIKNLQQSFETKQREVILLNDSIEMANSLFRYAKADYVEVLLVQEEKLKAQQELLEVKMNLIGSRVDLYRALGGGWK